MGGCRVGLTQHYTASVFIATHNMEARLSEYKAERGPAPQSNTLSRGSMAANHRVSIDEE